MKILTAAMFAAMCIATFGALATAQTIYRDSAGRIIGTSRDVTMPGSPPVTQFNDARGMPSGRAVGDGFGGYRFYDDAGREIGSAR